MELVTYLITILVLTVRIFQRSFNIKTILPQGKQYRSKVFLSVAEESIINLMKHITVLCNKTWEYHILQKSRMTQLQ